MVLRRREVRCRHRRRCGERHVSKCHFSLLLLLSHSFLIPGVAEIGVALRSWWGSEVRAVAAVAGGQGDVFGRIACSVEAATYSPSAARLHGYNHPGAINSV